MPDRSTSVADPSPAQPPAWVRDVLSQLGLLHQALTDLRDEMHDRRKPYITVREAAEQCGRSEYTIRRWITQGRVQASKVDGTGPHGRLLVARDDLERLLHPKPAPEAPGSVEVPRRMKEDSAK